MSTALQHHSERCAPAEQPDDQQALQLAGQIMPFRSECYVMATKRVAIGAAALPAREASNLKLFQAPAENLSEPRLPTPPEPPTVDLHLGATGRFGIGRPTGRSLLVEVVAIEQQLAQIALPGRRKRAAISRRSIRASPCVRRSTSCSANSGVVNVSSTSGKPTERCAVTSNPHRRRRHSRRNRHRDQRPSCS